MLILQSQIRLVSLTLTWDVFKCLADIITGFIQAV